MDNGPLDLGDNIPNLQTVSLIMNLEAEIKADKVLAYTMLKNCVYFV